MYAEEAFESGIFYQLSSKSIVRGYYTDLDDAKNAKKKYKISTTIWTPKKIGKKWEWVLVAD